MIKEEKNNEVVILTNNLLITVPLVMLGVALLALVIGFFALRTTGIYFLAQYGFQGAAPKARG